jgi:hypothetical protein
MSDKKKFIVVIFRDDIPEYTIDEIFTDEPEAQKAGEETLQEVLEDENKDIGTYTMKVLDITK